MEFQSFRKRWRWGREVGPASRLNSDLNAVEMQRMRKIH
jgi:hypothetical protein